jgi:hypothetical protein
MSVNTSEQTTPQPNNQTTPKENVFAKSIRLLREGFQSLRWSPILLFGAIAGILMPLSLIGGFGQLLSFFAGIIPVGAGILVARRAEGHYGLHGFMTGLLGATIALITLYVLLFFTNLGQGALTTVAPGAVLTVGSLFIQIGGFIAFSLLTFCTFGAIMSGRAQDRTKEMRKEVQDRGGSLERPGVIRTQDDIRGLSLPQFGSYVNNLFKKYGFTFKDYRFTDKDKHLDLWLEHEKETWHVRLTVQDKVAPGTVESLYQAMKEEDCQRGVVITSTEFMPSAIKNAKGRPIVLIDGRTLFEIAEG